MQKKINASQTQLNNKLSLIYSEEYNPWYNLALEEHLLNNLDDNEIILYLWQNDHTVVIGRNQNAWKECRCSQLEEEDSGFLARRLSGGGAVYHDKGNLNFTFILKRDKYNLKKQLSVILKAVKNLGIEAEFTGRNDLTAAGKKFSGNAFYYTKEKAYHHGTILFDTDIESLVDYLQVSKEKIKSKGIESVRSRVVNLKDLKENLSLEAVKNEVENSFIDIYSNENSSVNKKFIKPSKSEKLKSLYDKYSSWDWRYGRTPNFDIYFEKRFDWGGVELGINLKKGKIEELEVFTDAEDADLFLKINDSLKGKKLNKKIIIASLEELKDNNNSEQINDLQNWFLKRDI
ncbi:MAG: lipoate--protein ligase [Halanaerobium sp.]